jgi:hypothetical protein
LPDQPMWERERRNHRVQSDYGLKAEPVISKQYTRLIAGIDL